MNTARIAKRRLDWVICHDRAQTPGRVKGRPQELAGPFTRMVFDQHVTVLPDEVLYLDYDPKVGHGFVTIEREVGNET